MDAGQDLDQRRLAGAVLAEQCDDLARVDREVDGVDRETPGKAFVNSSATSRGWCRPLPSTPVRARAAAFSDLARQQLGFLSGAFW